MNRKPSSNAIEREASTPVFQVGGKWVLLDSDLAWKLSESGKLENLHFPVQEVQACEIRAYGVCATLKCMIDGLESVWRVMM
jgi:hypothetical protein